MIFRVNIVAASFERDLETDDFIKFVGSEDCFTPVMIENILTPNCWRMILAKEVSSTLVPLWNIHHIAKKSS